MADATRVIDTLAKQLAEAMKQYAIAQVELEETREKLAAEQAKAKEK